MKLINDKEVLDCGFCESGISPDGKNSCRSCNETVTNCPVCGEMLYKTPLGIRCKNGHESNLLNG